MIFIINDLHWAIFFIIMTPIEYNFRGQKVNFCPIWSNLTISLVLLIQYFLFFASMILVMADLDWCIKLENLAPIEHGCMGQRVKKISDIGRFDHILSFVDPIFFIFCMNDIYHEWFRSMYNVDNFNLDWALL